MISLSHWGMFKFRPRVLAVPAGFEVLDDLPAANSMQAGYMIFSAAGDSPKAKP